MVNANQKRRRRKEKKAVVKTEVPEVENRNAVGVPVRVEDEGGNVGGHKAAEDNGRVGLGLPAREKSDGRLLELATRAESYGRNRPLLDLAVPSISATSHRLMLWFQGNVYVCDSVTPEKMQEALQLLEGSDSCDEAPEMGDPGPALTCQRYDRRLDAILQRLNTPVKQVASLTQFQDKRKGKCFDKKIHHTVRKVVALSCNNCSISKNATPVTRRGPAGRRTLCGTCRSTRKIKSRSRIKKETPITRSGTPKSISNV